MSDLCAGNTSVLAPGALEDHLDVGLVAHEDVDLLLNISVNFLERELAIALLAGRDDLPDVLVCATVVFASSVSPYVWESFCINEHHLPHVHATLILEKVLHPPTRIASCQQKGNENRTDVLALLWMFFCESPSSS